MEHVGSAATTRDWSHGLFGGSRRLPTSAFLPALLALFLLPSPGWADEYFQYLPSALEAEATAFREDGILTKRITIRRGDTLSAISRRYSGKGFYYPQILLFNRIADPNRIFAGKELLVPLPVSAYRRGTTPASSETTRGVIPRDSGGTKHQTRIREKGKRISSGEARLYRQSVALQDQGDYRRALDGFTLFLKKYPDSPLSPDVHLHRADCYLRLSGPPDTRDLPR